MNGDFLTCHKLVLSECQPPQKGSIGSEIAARDEGSRRSKVRSSAQPEAKIQSREACFEADGRSRDSLKNLKARKVKIGSGRREEKRGRLFDSKLTSPSLCSPFPFPLTSLSPTHPKNLAALHFPSPKRASPSPLLHISSTYGRPRLWCYDPAGDYRLAVLEAIAGRRSSRGILHLASQDMGRGRAWEEAKVLDAGL